MFMASIPPPPFNSFDLGPLTVRLYGLAIAAGVLTAVWLARQRYAKAGGDPEFLDRVAIWVVLGGIVGARIGFVLPRIERFSDDPASALEVWEGGLTFFGGLLGGGLAGLFLLVRHHGRIGMMLTAVAPAIPLAQAIGRLGNYFNQELYGRPTELPWAVEIEPTFRMPGYELSETFHPTFAYEIIWNLALVGLLLWAGSKLKLRPGSLALVYLVTYGVGRFLLELIRIDTEARVLGLSRNAYNSILIVVLGAVALWWREVKRGGPEDTYLDYVEDEDEDAEEADEADEVTASDEDSESDGDVEDGGDVEAEVVAEASDADADGSEDAEDEESEPEKVEADANADSEDGGTGPDDETAESGESESADADADAAESGESESADANAEESGPDKDEAEKPRKARKAKSKG